MLKTFLMKQMLKTQLKNVPEGDRDRILNMVEKNPDLFVKIAEETQEKMKSGKDQMTSAMEVMQKYKDDLKGLV